MGFNRTTGLTALFATACAVASAVGPLETLRARDRQIRQILGDRGQPLTGEREARLRELVSGIFDYETHARESFGRYWVQMSERDRRQALQLVTALLERSSMEKVNEYRTDAIQYVSERIGVSDASSALITTRVQRDRERWEVAYRMRLADGQWRIVDVLIEGASTVENNRATFYKEIRTSGIEGLLAKLGKKVDGR